MITHYIQVNKNGLWVTVDYSESWDDALLLAASLCQTYNEDDIQIIDA